MKQILLALVFGVKLLISFGQIDVSCLNPDGSFSSMNDCVNTVTKAINEYITSSGYNVVNIPVQDSAALPIVVKASITFDRFVYLDYKNLNLLKI